MSETANPFRKLLLIAVFFGLWICIYKFFNNYNADPSRAIYMTRPVDIWPWIIQPWTSIIYIFLGVAIPLLPFWLYWNSRTFNRVFVAYSISSLFAFSIYAVWPLAITRPDFSGDSIGVWLMQTVIAVDNDANCFPSFHTSYAVLGAMFLASGAKSQILRLFSWMAAVAICVTTITTGQHYIIDVAGGIASAVTSYFTSLVFPPNWPIHFNDTNHQDD